MSIFKAYDVRGIYPAEINEDMVYDIARAFVIMREKEVNKTGLRIILGRDMRLSSPSLREAVKNGLLDQGADVIDIGLASTPTFYFAVCSLKADGGLLVSASHNPKNYNGIKMTREDAKAIGAGFGMEEIRTLAEAKKWTEPLNKGNYEEYTSITDEHVKHEEQGININSIKNFKIVADPANAMGIKYLDKMFADLPQIEIVKMNFELDGNFPVHEADPFKDENIADLKRKVVEEKADIGIATDGDGDRIFFIDNKGELVEPAIMRGIFARIFLRENPGAIICYDIRPGKITEDMIVENGGIPSVTKVGHSLIKQQMVSQGAVFGGESSGHFFVKFSHGTYEAPVHITLKLLVELSEAGQDFSDYVKPLKKYFHSGEINFKGADKAVVFSKLKEKYNDAAINDLDGLTFSYPDFWFNVRGSNTEALVRLNLEARSSEKMNEKTEEIKKIIEN